MNKIDRRVVMTSNVERTIEEFHPFTELFMSDPRSFDSVVFDHSPGFLVSDGMPTAFVAKHDQVQEVLKDWQRFSSVKPANIPGMERVDFFNGQPVMNYSDPPNHTRIRGTVHSAFSPRRVKQMAESTSVIIEELFSAIKPGQSIDAVTDIGRPLSINLLLKNFLGVAEKDYPIFLEFASTLPLIDKLKPGEPKPKAYLEAWEKGEKYCRAVLEQAKTDNSENVISMVANAVEGDSLSDAEMMAMMVVLFTGGIATVASIASSALYYLAHNPDVAERIRKDPSLASKHMEETLRLDAPVSLVMRFAQEDVEIGGKVIKKGMPVYVMISSASRDPGVFENPLDFNIDRGSARHLAFGMGIHNCIGNNITRNTLPLLIVAAANKFPNLKPDLTKPVRWEATARSCHRATVPLLT